MEDVDLKKFAAESAAVVERLRGEFMGLRSNRPSTRLIEDIRADYFGQTTPIKQLGSIMIVPPMEMAVSVWDKGAVAEVAKAIEAANTGLSVSVDGNTVRLKMPVLTDARRQELIKLAKAMAERERIRVRNLRDEANKKAKAIEGGEDTQFFFKEEVQKLTQKANGEIDALLAAKIAELEE